ncbi:MAG: PPK2 family polyphosphate kinase [Verrucomicrobiales bacterium]
MKPFLVSPGAKVDLDRWDPNDTSAFSCVNKEDGTIALEAVRLRMRELQARLIAQRRHKVLILFQAMDAGGKDGTVRNVFQGLDPHGLGVVAFKAPTAAELERDFLWRVHARVPGRGEITIWNRSHYEDVVAVRVRKLAPRDIWEKRFEHIVNFERLLADEGTVVLKFFLHIDATEQKARLEGRLKDPSKQWKLQRSDIDDRASWNDFIKAYEEAMSRTSTPHAPWYVVPANKKWYRNLVVATTVRDALDRLKPEFPPLPADLAGVASL